MGIRPGDRVGTFASTTARHMEVWYGAAGMGAVYHPVNPRLFEEHLKFIIDHAGDRLMFVDPQYVPLLEKMAGRFPDIEQYVVFADARGMPATSLRNAVDYESWLGEADGDFAWPAFDENTAAGLFYTSGTTGRPKGVLYSHRSIVLLSLAVNAVDMYAFSARDVVMMVVPMYHANGWSWPFTAPMSGASLVLPGMRLDGASLIELATQHRVTVSGGVPTVWQGVLQQLDASQARLPAFRRLFIGGAPCPPPMLDAFRVHGVDVIHVWGMTEMGPTGSACSLTPETEGLEGDALAALQQRQGRPPFLVEMKLVDDRGGTLPWDDKAVGNLKVRGPCIVRRYFGEGESDVLDEEGFFDTGDVAKIDANGFMCITDRAKDLIKSGGEWISSIELEGAMLSHPAVAEAAALAALHPKWDERPVLIIAIRAGRDLSKAEALVHLAGRVPKWWLPDEVIFITDMPHTATGKINKLALRDRYRNVLLEQGKG
jgi:fatty-acyl-CoA synthase